MWWFFILCLSLFRWQPGVCFQHKVLQSLDLFLKSSKHHLGYKLCPSLLLLPFLRLLLHLVRLFFAWLLIIVDSFLVVGLLWGHCIFLNKVLRCWLSVLVMATNKSPPTSLFFLRLHWLWFFHINYFLWMKSYTWCSWLLTSYVEEKDITRKKKKYLSHISAKLLWGKSGLQHVSTLLSVEPWISMMSFPIVVSCCHHNLCQTLSWNPLT